MTKLFLALLVALLLAACATSTGKRAPSAEAGEKPSNVEARPAPSVAQPLSGRTTGSCAVMVSTIQNEFIQRVNAIRSSGRRCGYQAYGPATSLRWSSTLAQLAAVHSEDMRQMKAFGHGGSDGSSVMTRAQRVGYPYRAIAENVAYGSPADVSTIEATMHDWLESPGHCANIVDPRHTEFGVACSEIPATAQVMSLRFWTMVLGRPQTEDRQAQKH